MASMANRRGRVYRHGDAVVLPASAIWRAASLLRLPNGPRFALRTPPNRRKGDHSARHQSFMYGCCTGPVTQIWAHRGDRANAAENSIRAFALAVEHGADGIELDVHLSADGQLVVHHDEHVLLADGSRAAIAQLSDPQLRGLRVGDERLGRQPVPTLPEVFELLAPTRLQLNVEIKYGATTRPGIEEAVLEAGRVSGLAERIVYSSFNHFALLRLRELDQDLEIAPLYADGLVEPWRYLRQLDVEAVHPAVWNLRVPGVLAGLQEHGFTVRTWTVNEPADWRWLVAAGIEAIITDHPREAVQLRESLVDGPAVVSAGEPHTGGRVVSTE